MDLHPRKITCTSNPWPIASATTSFWHFRPGSTLPLTQLPSPLLKSYGSHVDERRLQSIFEESLLVMKPKLISKTLLRSSSNSLKRAIWQLRCDKRYTNIHSWHSIGDYFQEEGGHVQFTATNIWQSLQLQYPATLYEDNGRSTHDTLPAYLQSAQHPENLQSLTCSRMPEMAEDGETRDHAKKKV